MKKVILSLLCVLMLIPFVTGCDKKIEEEKPAFEVFDSQVKYVVVKGKKIYLAKNYTDLFKQFDGLGCYIRKDGDISVDDIIKNNEIEKYKGQQIVCYTNEEKNYITGAVRINYIINTKITTYTELFYVSFSGDNFDVVTDKATVLFGDEGRTASTIKEAVKAFENEPQIEKEDYSSYSDYTFKDEKYEYKFQYSDQYKDISNFFFKVNIM